MHILLVSSMYPSIKNPVKGIFVHQQALALQMAGHQVGVIVPQYPHPRRVLNGSFSLRDAIRHSKYEGIPVWNFLFDPLPGLHRKITKAITVRVIKKYIAEIGRPDVIHAHFIFYGGVIASSIRGKLGLPLVITAHASEHFLEKKSRSRSDETGRILAGAQQAISVSQFLADRLGELTGFARIKIVPNLVDTSFFTIKMDEKDQTSFTFTAIGNLVPLKRFDNLITAFSSLAKENEIHLNIIGAGPQEKDLRKLVNKLSVEKKISFIGQLNRRQLRDYFWKTDTLVSTSDIETFGVSLIEAMACGVPVLATRSGGPEEIINETNGFLIESPDVDHIAKGLRTMLQDRQRFDPETIRAGCVEKYGYKTIAEQLTAVYKEVLQRRGPDPLV